MSVVRTLIGNIKGPQGATGATGATGPQGDAATVNVGSVSTTAYGNAAQVTNVGTENDAILNFVIPQGKPGEKTTTMSGLTLDTVTTSADEFPVPAVSENGSTVWGKVIKFFQDTVAALTGKLDANKIVNSQAVTESGYGLDALQANPSVSGSLAAQISDLNDSLNNKIKLVSGTTPSSAMDGILAFPAGFNYENCSVANVEILFNGIWRSITSMISADEYVCIVTLRQTGIFLFPMGANSYSKSIRVTLIKYGN